MNSPRMQRFGRLLLVVFALACVMVTVAFAEGETPDSVATAPSCPCCRLWWQSFWH